MNTEEQPTLLGNNLIQNLNFPYFLAPMVGLSHVGLRAMVNKYLPKGATTLWPTEMLNSRKIPKEDLGQTNETLRASWETNLWPQILGNEYEPIQESIIKLKQWGAVGIDINMGCPVKKALQHNYGVALMGSIEYASKVVAMASDHNHLPISVKLRAGLEKNDNFLIEFVDSLIASGANWITIHPRIASQGRRGEADWNQIELLKSKFSIPIIGNGDVQTLEDVFKMKKQTGCDGVMIGRALLARPWLFWQIGEELGMEAPEEFKNKRAPQGELEEGEELGRALLCFCKTVKEHFSEDAALKRVKFLIRHNHVWLEFGHTLFTKMSNCKNMIEVENNIKEFFSTPQKMYKKTSLRI